MGHLRHNNNIAQITYILLEQLQLGDAGKLFQFPIAPVMRYIEPCWLTCVWTFDDHLQAKRHIEESWELQPQRTNDQCLTDIFQHQQYKLKPKELKRLNAC